MKKILFAIAIAATALGACKNAAKTTHSATSQTTTIAYTEAKNYFVRNDYKEAPLHTLKLTSQAEFESVFGMAPLANAMPTPIDFSTHYALACIAETSDKISALTPKNLKKEGDNIVLTYKQIEGEKRSFSGRYAFILLVDIKEIGNIKLVKE